MHGVTFSYDHVTPVVQDIDLVAEPGQRIALVGHTGCGKTTLINLLMRFYEQDEGAILLDGTDTRSFTRESLRQAFGMVLQDSWLFGASVRDNVAFGLDDVSDDEVWAALRAAHADKFVRQLPQGLDTQVREEGGTLSAGQCQLLCIARAMLQDAPILILDEATSSIDSRTERLVQEACDRMMRGRTSIVVAHRLSTIQEADTILMMDHGKIIERGSHEELLARHSAYERLYLSQWSDTDEKTRGGHAQIGSTT
jgi:ATP-binding cassette subfamily B protein